MKKIKSILAALVLALGLLVAVGMNTAATAGWLCDWSGGTQCGDVRHGSPDYGDDRPILATCNLADPWSTAQWVAEGREATCRDTDGFWVEYGTFLTCTFHGDGYGSLRVYHTGTWKKITDGENWNCVVGGS